MKKLFYLFLLPLSIAVVACGGKKEGSGEKSVLATLDSIDARGIQRMQASHSRQTITYKGKEYLSTVSRTPDESLPHVVNEMGDTYVDNKISLSLATGGHTIFARTFTKNDFAAVVDASFLAKAVLEGIVYDKATPQGILYAGSVCYPQTDLYVPLSILITADGKMQVWQIDRLEDVFEAEEEAAR